MRQHDRTKPSQQVGMPHVTKSGTTRRNTIREGMVPMSRGSRRVCLRRKERCTQSGEKKRDNLGKSGARNPTTRRRTWTTSVSFSPHCCASVAFFCWQFRACLHFTRTQFTDNALVSPPSLLGERLEAHCDLNICSWKRHSVQHACIF